MTPRDTVQERVDTHAESRDPGVLGGERVNVPPLDLAPYGRDPCVIHTEP